MSGKKYLNSVPVEQRNKNDLYHTPFGCTWELLKQIKKEGWGFENLYEPAAGAGAIANASSIYYGENVFQKVGDIITGQDFLKEKIWEGDILTNFPFLFWDKMVYHAKKICSGKICTIGRLNYLGTVSRYEFGIWEGLESIYVFNRYVDYRTPYRDDGSFHVGGICSGWFLWVPGYKGDPKIKILDVQKYSFLGQYKGESWE